MAEHPPPLCRTCEGSGRVAPSPFHDDSVPWPLQVRVAAQKLTAGYCWQSSPTATGRVRPLPCPDCDGVDARPPPC